jgi:hypothetical protein
MNRGLRERAESANLYADARRSIVSKFKIDGGAGEPSNSPMQFDAIPVQSPSGRPDNRQSGSCKKLPPAPGEQRPGVGSVEEKMGRQQLKT